MALIIQDRKAVMAKARNIILIPRGDPAEGLKAVVGAGVAVMAGAAVVLAAVLTVAVTMTTVIVSVMTIVAVNVVTVLIMIASVKQSTWLVIRAMIAALVVALVMWTNLVVGM